MPLVEQELFSLPQHLSSSTVFSGVRIAWSLVFCVMFFVNQCLSLCSFLLVIVLSVLLLVTASDYPFGILNLIYKARDHRRQAKFDLDHLFFSFLFCIGYYDLAKNSNDIIHQVAFGTKLTWLLLNLQ